MKMSDKEKERFEFQQRASVYTARRYSRTSCDRSLGLWPVPAGRSALRRFRWHDWILLVDGGLSGHGSFSTRRYLKRFPLDSSQSGGCSCGATLAEDSPDISLTSFTEGCPKFHSLALAELGDSMPLDTLLERPVDMLSVRRVILGVCASKALRRRPSAISIDLVPNNRRWCLSP